MCCTEPSHFTTLISCPFHQHLKYCQCPIAQEFVQNLEHQHCPVSPTFTLITNIYLITVLLCVCLVVNNYHKGKKAKNHAHNLISFVTRTAFLKLKVCKAIENVIVFASSQSSDSNHTSKAPESHTHICRLDS